MLRRFSTRALIPLVLGVAALAVPFAQGGGGRGGDQGGGPQGRGARAGGAQGQGQGQGEETPVGQQMEIIGDALRTVGRGWEANGASPELLTALANAEKAILAAKGEVPSMLAQEADAAKKAAMLTEFHKALNGLLRGMLDVEDALVAGDGDAVKAGLEKLGKMKDAGHEQFRPRRGGRR